jgi:hypothetical protein
VGVEDILNDLAVDFALVEDRAGRYARQSARFRQKALLEAAWRRLIVVPVLGVAAVGLTLLLPHWARAFVAGAWLATVAWLLVFLVDLVPGNWPIEMRVWP